METDNESLPINLGGVNNPNLDEEGNVQTRAIRDGKQAWSVYKSLFDANRSRNRRNAEILEVYIGRQPKNPQQLIDEGRDWESNFPTLFVAGIMDRVVPNLIKAVDSAKYLTQACVDSDYDSSADDEGIADQEQYQKISNEAKTQCFRDKFTKKLRQWNGWRPLIYSTCQEDVLLGYSFWIWTDEDTPFPEFANSGTIALPDGTPQESKSVQVFGFEQPVLIHEFVGMIKHEGAFVGGWNKEECILSANHALPFDPNGGYNTINERGWTDIIREGNLGASYQHGAKVVNLGHLFAIEPDSKKVSHFIVDSAAPERVLFQRFDRFDSMEDVISIFTLEPGNGKISGSKGVGRMISNYGVAIDEITNDAVDKVRMDGMPIVQTDSRTATQAQIRVRKPFIAIIGDATFKEQMISFDPDKVIALSTHLGKMAEIAAGAYIPNLASTEGQGGGDKTAREATIDYNRETQAQTAFITRFIGQLAIALSCIQRRFCNPDSTDQDVKDFIQELKDEEDFTDDEIRSLAEYPAYEIGQDLSDVEGQKKIALYSQFAGNPLVDQGKLLESAVIALSDPEYAKYIILPNGIDPTIETENVRQQIMENSAIMTGESVPISPRDDHNTHLRVLMGEMQQAIPQLMQDPTQLTPELLDHINAGMIHGEAHVAALDKLGKTSKDDLKKKEDFFKFVDTFLKEAGKQMQKQQIAQQKAQQQQAQATAAPSGEPQQGYNPQEPTEKVIVAWIGQYDKLPEDEKRKLETISGLGASQMSPAAPVEPPEPDMPPSFDQAEAGAASPSASAGGPPEVPETPPVHRSAVPTSATSVPLPPLAPEGGGESSGLEKPQ